MKIGSVKTMVAAAAAAMLGFAAEAGDGKWIFDPAKGTSVQNPALWSDPSNWTNGVIPSTKSDYANLSAATGRYIRVDSDIKVRNIIGCSNAADYPTLFGEGSIEFATSTSSAYSITQFNAFLPLTFNTSGNVWDNMRLINFADQVNFVNANHQVVLGRDNKVVFRPDWFAKSSNPVRQLETTVLKYVIHYSSVYFYAPEGLAEAATSTWKLQSGSPYAVPVGEPGHALPAGTIVTSSGYLPDDVFLKRIFPDGTIELSAAALDSSDAASLTFAAFTPQLSHEITSIGRSVENSSTFIYGNKYRDEDSFVIDVRNLTDAGPTRQYCLGCESGYKPAIFRVWNDNNTAFRLMLCNSRIEFPAKATVHGIPKASLECYSNGNKGYVTVPENVVAQVGTVTNVQNNSQLVKEGAGTLKIGRVHGGSVTGWLVAKEGTLEFAEQEAPVAIKNLAVTNGASVKVPACGLKITTTLKIQEGANFSGKGMVILPNGTDLSQYPADAGVPFVTQDLYDGIDAADYTPHTPVEAATSPLDDGLPAPAAWFDASYAASLETTEGESQLNLTKWNDRRGDGYPFATAASETYFPQVVTNKQGGTHHIYIANRSTMTLSNTRALKYDKDITGVRAVFKAWNGCGQFFGNDNNQYMRASGGYSQPLCYQGGTKLPGDLYVNGEYNPHGSAAPMPYASQSANDKSKMSPMVTDFHLPSANAATMKYIGFQSGGIDRNGGDRLCEMLIYTNALTSVQRRKIQKYLMKRWTHVAPDEGYGKFADRKLTADMTGKDFELPVAAGRVQLIEKLSGQGTIVKSGAGTAYVNQLEDGQVSIGVAEGVLDVRSPLLDAGHLPGDPYLHFDASAAETVITNNSGKVTSWQDVRGGSDKGYGSANEIASGKGASVLQNVLNGLPMLSFSQRYQGTTYADSPGLQYPETDRFRSVFKVCGGSYGLIGSFIGRAEGARYNGVLHSFNRTQGAYGYVSTYKWMEGANTTDMALEAIGTTYEPGGPFMRVDGVECKNPKDQLLPAGNPYVTLAFNGYDDATCDAIGCNYGSQGNYYWGEGMKLGEQIIYTNSLTRADALKVEAYLRAKWFNVDPVGYKPAVAKSIEVAAGAELVVSGGAPLTTDALACAGAVEGAVNIADGGVYTVVRDANGAVIPPTGSGVITALGDFTVAYPDGTKLPFGEYLIANSFACDPARASFAGLSTFHRSYSVILRDGKLYLSVTSNAGFQLLVR